MNDKDYIENIILNGTREEKIALYNFDDTMSEEEVARRFLYFVVGNYIRYFADDSAPFHDEMIRNYIKAYRGQKFLNIGFRGSAKTSLKKLFDVYVILNDTNKKRSFIKIVTKDIKISKQIVTDVYNLIVEVAPIYGDVFEKEGKTKREESMSAFTLKSGVRYASGTVGQTQRGQVQDAYRPDFLWFEDIEDKDTMKSMVQTSSIIDKSDEAIQGLSVDGSYAVTANYITEEGVIEWFKRKKDIVTMITPICDSNGEPTWKRFTKEKIEAIKADAEDWEGDYMCDPTSGKDKFFNIDRVKELIERAEDAHYEKDFIKFWDEYKPHHMYAVGGDTAEGIGRDANALTLWNFTKNAVVGTYYSAEIGADMFGYEMAKVGGMFGNCLLAPERNNTGHATIATLTTIEYDNIYAEKVTDEFTKKETKKLGWNTTRKTKPTMWLAFRKDFNDGVIDIKCKDLLDEILHYTKADYNDRSQGVITRHFDLLTSAVIGWQMKDEVFLNVGELRTSYM